MADDLFEIPMLVDRFLRRIFEKIHEELKDVDLPITSQDIKILMLIHEHKTMPISKLVTRTRRDKSQITRKVREFETKDLVRRTPSKQDQRVSMVELTPQGIEIAKMLHETLTRALNNILEPLSKTEKLSLADVLRKVI